MFRGPPPDPGLVSTFERVDDLVQFFLLALCTEDRRLAKLLLQILWVIKSETPPVHAQRIRGALLSPGNLPLLVEACVMFSDDVMCALPVLKWVAREGLLLDPLVVLPMPISFPSLDGVHNPALDPLLVLKLDGGMSRTQVHPLWSWSLPRSRSCRRGIASMMCVPVDLVF